MMHILFRLLANKHPTTINCADTWLHQIWRYNNFNNSLSIQDYWNGHHTRGITQWSKRGLFSRAGGGGYSPENGKQVRAALVNPSILAVPKTHPPFHYFSVPKGSTFTWNHSFFLICISKGKNQWIFQFLSLKFDKISVPTASNWIKNQLRPQILQQSIL